jgi:hypothetical protein
LRNTTILLFIANHISTYFNTTIVRKKPKLVGPQSVRGHRLQRIIAYRIIRSWQYPRRERVYNNWQIQVWMTFTVKNQTLFCITVCVKCTLNSVYCDSSNSTFRASVIVKLKNIRSLPLFWIINYHEKSFCMKPQSHHQVETMIMNSFENYFLLGGTAYNS